MKMRFLSLSVLLMVFCLMASCMNETVNLSWVTSDVQYNPESEMPDTLINTQTIKVWRGEHTGAQALMTLIEPSEKPLTLEADKPSDDWNVQLAWVRPVITNDFRTCGTPPDTLTAYLVYDLIDANSTLDADMDKTYSVWCSIDVPRDAKVGKHQISCKVKDGGTTVGSLSLNIEVLDKTLPEAKDYTFDLNLWQQPYSVSRYYKVEQWSDEHLKLLRPYLKSLARAGQKTVSTILFYEPWGVQSNDKFEPMVATTLKENGEWAYDFTAFDKYVNLCAECGIDQSIDCYSMVPWDMSFRYFDEKSDSYKTIEAKTTDKAYADLWKPFLQSLAAHLKEKGWFEKTRIAMDERDMNDMLNAYKIAQEAVPGIKMSLAGVYHEELAEILDYYCLTYNQEFPEEVLKLRKSRGQISTSYTCCADQYPSLFSNAAPVESEFIPLTCMARGFDGFLHWSWINWTDNPVEDTRFKLFAPGDTYFYYPDNRPSIHWERFVAGIDLTEKIRLTHQQTILKDWSSFKPEDTAALSRFVASVKAAVNQ